ncbi:leucine-rich repeat protein, partial [Xylanibacter rodentium]
FKNCKNLKHISLPKSVTKVEYWSFENCPAFEKK